MAKKTVKKTKKQTAKAGKHTLKLKKKPVRKVLKKKTTRKAQKKKVSAIPKGYHSITPYLIIEDASAAIEFYKRAFGAKEVLRMGKPGGKVGHAELKFGDAKIMLADEYPEMQARGPQAFGGSPVSIHLYVKNVDATVEKALAAGGKWLRPIENMFYGDRSGAVVDPFGYTWNIATHVEDVTPAQLKKRAAALFGGN